jgi:hypothetical protein
MQDPATRASGQLGEYGTMPRNSERPFSEIVTDIVGHAQEIVRSEIRLAKTEVKDELSKAAAASVMLAVAVVCGLEALGFVLWTIAYAVGIVAPMWVGALAVGVLLGIVAAVCASIGVSRFREVKTTPERAVREVKEDVEWLKQQTK